MLIRWRDLVSLRIDTGDTDEHRVSDILVDDQLALAYIIADFNGWFEHHKAVVRAADFEPPELGGRRWPARLSRDEIRLAPAPENRNAGTADQPEGEALRAANLENADCRVGPALFQGGADGLPRGRMHSVKQFLGATVEAPDREAGRVIDLIFDFDLRRATALVVETGQRAAEHQRVVPVDMLADLDWAFPQVRLRCPASRLDESPELHDVPLERNWWNAVRTYYGL